jgi:hypothetical protein
MADKLTPVVLWDDQDKQFNSKLEAILVPFKKRFDGYDTKEALIEYMGRNKDPEVQGERPCREMWVALANEAGEIVAFTNRQISVLKTEKHGTVATSQDSYVYVDPDKFTTPELKETAEKQLYAVAKAETEKFVMGAELSGGNSLPTYNFAVEATPFLFSRNHTRENQPQSLEDLGRLERAGFGRVETRYLEANYDTVNGKTIKSYDQFAILPEGVSSVPTEIYTSHIEGNLRLAYAEGSSLTNEALAPMKASIERQGVSGQINVLPPKNYTELAEKINALTPKTIPEGMRGKPMGELTPELQQLAIDHYGPLIKDYKDRLPTAAMKVEALEAAQGVGSLRPAASQDEIPAASNVTDLVIGDNGQSKREF